jgi:hypothetical protein
MLLCLKEETRHGFNTSQVINLDYNTIEMYPGVVFTMPYRSRRLRVLPRLSLACSPVSAQSSKHDLSGHDGPLFL